MKCLLLHNPNSGKKSINKKIDKILVQLKKYGVSDVRVYASQAPKDLMEYIIHNGEKYDLLLVFGGDGTLNEVMNGLMRIEKKPRLMYLPAGTVNDVGHMLGLSRNYRKTFRLLKNDPVKMDICQMNDWYFVYVAACGKFTNVSYDVTHVKRKRTFGKLYYYFRGLSELKTPVKMRLKASTKEEEIEGNYYLMLALNSQRIGNFHLHRRKKVKLNDGKINVLLFKNGRFASWMNMINYFLFGDYLKNGIEEIECSQIQINSDHEVQFNTDGEKNCLANSAFIQVHPLAVDVYASKRAIKLFFIQSEQD